MSPEYCPGIEECVYVFACCAAGSLGDSPLCARVVLRLNGAKRSNYVFRRVDPLSC